MGKTLGVISQVVGTIFVICGVFGFFGSVLNLILGRQDVATAYAIFFLWCMASGILLDLWGYNIVVGRYD